MPEPTLMQKLLNCTDKESIMHEVGKRSETEAKTALIAALLSWRFGNKVHKEIMQGYDSKIVELEKQLPAQNNV